MEYLITAFYIVACVVLFSLAIAIHEFGHFIVALKLGLRVEAFSIGFGPALWKKKVNGVEYRISAIPLGGYVSIPDVDPEGTKALEGAKGAAPKTTERIPAWKELAVAFAGPAMNLVLAVVLAVLLALVPSARFGVLPAEIGGVLEDSPAERGGLKAGDAILSVGGNPVNTWGEMQTEVQIAGGKATEFVTQRGTFTVTPEKDSITGAYFIKAYSVTNVTGAAMWMPDRNPLKQLAWDSGSIFRVLKGLVTPKEVKATAGALGGPVMIAEGLYRQVRRDPWDGIGFLRFLNVNLAILNLLPIPVLDGGLILFSLIALVFRRRLPDSLIKYVSLVFMYALIGLMGILILKDSYRSYRIHHALNERDKRAEVKSTTGASQFLWAELIAFDNAAPDHGVNAYLSRMPFKPKGISFLLFDPDIIHSHTDLKEDFRIGDFHCAYNARPFSLERRRQPWTAWQLRSLIAELKRHGVEAYASVFDMAPAHSPDLAKWGIVRKEHTWLDGHPEVGYQLADAKRVANVCLIKRLADESYYSDFFTERLVHFLKDYGFAGFHAADGYGHPRYPLNCGDFSDDVVGQFRAAFPQLAIPEGAVSVRAEWILKNARYEWCQFYAQRHAECFAKMTQSLHKEGLSIYLNSCWTREPHEAMYRYGVDIQRLEEAGIDGFFVEGSVAGLEIEGWRFSDVSVLDTRRAAYLRLAGATKVPLIRLCCVKDDLEQFNALRHSPMRTQGEVLGLGITCCGDRFAAPTITWSLADAVTAAEWRQMDKDGNLLPPVSKADDVRVVYSAKSAVAELKAECEGRWPSSSTLLARLIHNGAVVVSGISVEAAIKDETLPLLVLNPGRFPNAELTALRKRTAKVVEFGFGAAECEFSDSPKDAEPTSWLYALPERTLPVAAYQNAVKAINESSGVKPDAGMADLRLASYFTDKGERVILAMNDRATYLEAKILVKGKVTGVRALTESPSLPVTIEPLENGDSRLYAKIPPAGVIALLAVGE